VAETDLEERMNRIEYAIWGFNGDNGLLAEFRSFRREISRWRREERERREEEAKQARRDAIEAGKERFRNRLTVIGLVMFGLLGFAGAVVQVVNAVGGGG
jgi:hypothetical protein